MSSRTRADESELSAEILPLLPVLYVAWADGTLTNREIEQVRRRVSQIPGLDGASLGFLDRWLDPDAPPSALDLVSLLGLIDDLATGADTSAREQSLKDLGLALAAPRRIRGEVVDALRDIEQAMGLASYEAARELLAEVERRARPPVEAKRPEAFSVREMAALLDGDHGELRDRVRETLSREEYSYRYDEPSVERRERTLLLLQQLADEGLGALAYPRSAGGSDDIGAAIAVFETLAYGDLSLLVKFGVQFGLFGGSILQLGTEKHHRKYLGRVATLELPGCFAMSETGHGSNVRDIETTADYDRDSGEFVLDTPNEAARKDWIGNAAVHGRMATVFAQLRIDGEDYGVHAFLAPIRDEEGDPVDGVRITDCGHKLGLNGVDNGRLSFHGLRIPRENLLDRFATVASDGTYSSPITSHTARFFTMVGTLVAGRVSVACAALSATKSALTIAIRYSARRRQFGPAGEPEVPILDYLNQQRRLMPPLALSYALDFALEDLVGEYVDRRRDGDAREIEARAAGLKAYASWHAVSTLQTAREACGGQGYLAENRLADLKADAEIFTTFEGDNTILMQLVTRGLLSKYREQFEDMRFVGLIRHVTGRAATAVTRLNPVTTRNTDRSHLLSAGFQLDALRYREDRLLSSLARRLKALLDEGKDTFDAFNACQDHALSLARAHVERHVIEALQKRVEAQAEGRLRSALTDLRDLAALHLIERDRAWFLEAGYLEAAKSKAIRSLVNDLCARTRQIAEDLVSAFGIPDRVLAAPIAHISTATPPPA